MNLKNIFKEHLNLTNVVAVCCYTFLTVLIILNINALSNREVPQRDDSNNTTNGIVCIATLTNEPLLQVAWTQQVEYLEGIQNFTPASPTRACLQVTNYDIVYTAPNDSNLDFLAVQSPISINQIVALLQRILVEHHYGTISRAAMTISIGTSSTGNEEPNDFSDNN